MPKLMPYAKKSAVFTSKKFSVFPYFSCLKFHADEVSISCWKILREWKLTGFNLFTIWIEMFHLTANNSLRIHSGLRVWGTDEMITTIKILSWLSSRTSGFEFHSSRGSIYNPLNVKNITCHLLNLSLNSGFLSYCKTFIYYYKSLHGDLHSLNNDNGHPWESTNLLA